MSKVELRLKELGITLPRPPKAVANYLGGVKVGEILYVAGTVGTVVNEHDEDVLTIKGKLGRDLTIEQGYQSARFMAINHLAMMKAVIGDLDRIVRIIKMVGYVNAAPGFREAPWVGMDVVAPLSHFSMQFADFFQNRHLAPLFVTRSAYF
jgi:enamine deaminase RidA (YjgF/YER057c/UK114 family)